MIKRACIDSSPLKAHLSTILKLRTAYIIKNPCATRGVSQATLAAMQGRIIGKDDSGVIFHGLMTISKNEQKYCMSLLLPC